MIFANGNYNYLGYYIGIASGTLLILLMLGWAIYSGIKNIVYQKLLRRVGVDTQKAIIDDLQLWARHTKNRFINNSIIKVNNDNLYQIDAILITSKALIVVKTKSIRGQIKGLGQDLTWIKTIKDKSYQIKNPIIENDLHINVIKQIINKNIPILSLIIFSNKADSIIVNDIPKHAIIAKHIDIFKTLDQINTQLSFSLDKQIKRRLTRVIRANLTSKSPHLLIDQNLLISNSLESE